jgi:hypothetical protein
MKIIWGRIIARWEIFVVLGGLLIGAIIWVHDVSGYGGEIERLKTNSGHQGAVITRMDYNIQIIARKIGVEPLTPEKEEGANGN